MFLATVLLTPAICSSSEWDAVFKSSPTLFTESSTTPLKLLLIFFYLNHVILTNTYTFWIYFYKFCQRILKSSSYGNCPSNRYIYIWMLFCCQFWCWINWCSCFINNNILSIYTNSFINSEIKVSDSLDAVPLPIAITSIL